MNFVMIVLFVLGCLAAYKAFGAEDSRQKKLYALIAIVLGGVLYYLGNYAPK